MLPHRNILTGANVCGLGGGEDTHLPKYEIVDSGGARNLS